MSKVKFKDWFEARHGTYPGEDGTRIDVSMRIIADAMAEWADLVAEGKIPEAQEPTGAFGEVAGTPVEFNKDGITKITRP